MSTGIPNPPPAGAYFAPQGAPPMRQLRSDRSLGMFILLTVVTLGIYAIIFFASAANDLNTLASRYDGRKTMHFALLFFIIGPITFGIGFYVWFHIISGRVGNELRRRQVYQQFDASTFWLWAVLGSLIVVGPFVYVYKFCEAMNALTRSYNLYG